MIKPCPFCGNDVYLTKLPLWRTYNDSTTDGYCNSYEYDIHCEECGCRVNLKGNDTIYRSDEEAKQNAINAWNRRKENK